MHHEIYLTKIAPEKLKTVIRHPIKREDWDMIDTNMIVEKKPAFTLVGIGRDFHKGNCYKEIPQFWNEYMTGGHRPFRGQFGVCVDRDSTMHYLISDIYYPWITVLPGWETITLEEGEWAMFSADGPLPESLQKVNTYVWSEWVPMNREYRLRANYSLEFYPHEVKDSKYTHSEIWLPVEKIQS